MSPCRAPTLKPCFCSDLCKSATSRLRLQKMIALFRSFASPNRRRNVSRFWCGSRLTLTWNWATPAAVVAGLETSIFSGLWRKVSVMRAISGGMVAQPAGSCNQDIDAAGQLGVLIAERNASDQKRDVKFLAGAILVELFLD